MVREGEWGFRRGVCFIVEEFEVSPDITFTFTSGEFWNQLEAALCRSCLHFLNVLDMETTLYVCEFELSYQVLARKRTFIFSSVE